MFRFLKSVKSQLFFMLLVFSILIVGTLTITLTVSLNTMKKENRAVLQESISKRYDTMIKAQVQQAMNAMQVEWDKRVNDSQGTEACRALLRSLRYLDDKSGYFWADDFFGVNQVHGAKPELEGKVRIESVDSHGFKLIKEIIQVGQEEGGGFTNYYFTKANDKEHEYPKRGYSATFKPLSWVVGTGNYVDDIDKEINSYAGKLEKGFNNLQLDTSSRIAIIILVLFFALFLASIRILDLIRKLNDALMEITQIGTDLKVNLPLKGPTELVEAARSFNEFIGSIREILTSFARDANAIGAANQNIYAKLGDLSENLHQATVQMRSLLKSTMATPASILQGIESMRGIVNTLDKTAELTDQISKDARKRNEVYANTTAELIRFKLDD